VTDHDRTRDCNCTLVARGTKPTLVMFLTEQLRIALTVPWPQRTRTVAAAKHEHTACSLCYSQQTITISQELSSKRKGNLTETKVSAAMCEIQTAGLPTTSGFHSPENRNGKKTININAACDKCMQNYNGRTSVNHSQRVPSTKNWNFRTKILVNFRIILGHFTVSKISTHTNSLRVT